MANSHIQPSQMAETQGICGDLLSPAILASTLSAPGTGMTLPAFTTFGYVRNGTPTRLCYVNQGAMPVTLSGGDGVYWLALHHDTHSAVASWTRQAGTHYLWRAAGTQPADPPGGLVMAGVTVAGGAITGTGVVNHPHQWLARGGPAGEVMFEKNLTWNGSTLTVAGRVDPRGVTVADYAQDSAIAFYTTLNSAGGTNRWALYAGGDAPTHLGGSLGVLGAISGGSSLTVTGRGQFNGGLRVHYGLGLSGDPQPGYELYVHTTSPSFFAGPLWANGVSGFSGTYAAGYGITCHSSSQFAANMTIGMIGTAATFTLDVNGSVRARSNFWSDSTGNFLGLLTASGGLSVPTNISAGTATFSGAVTVNGHLSGTASIYAGSNLRAGGTLVVSGLSGFGMEVQSGWHIACAGSILAYGTLQVNGHVQGMGSATFNGALRTGSTFVASLEAGFGREAAGGYSIATVGAVFCGGVLTTAGLTVSGATTLNSTLNVAGTSQFALCGIGVAAVGDYWIRAGRTWLDDLSLGGGNRGYTLDNYGSMYVSGRVDMVTDARVHGALSVGIVEPAAEGYAFHCATNAKFRAALQCDGPASKPGGGVWLDSNSQQKFKQNVRPLGGGLQTLLALQERQWEWAPEYPDLEALLPGTRTGFVIEEVASVKPEWVTRHPVTDEPLLAISGFEALTVSALREIVQRLEALEQA